MKITLTKRTDNFHVCPEGSKIVWAYGKTVKDVLSKFNHACISDGILVERIRWNMDDAPTVEYANEHGCEYPTIMK